MPPTEHLIGAYGLHWRRNEVTWKPGAGTAWQLLGRSGTKRPGLRVCDFRFAAGVYVLERRGHPVYAGLARSGQGLGARLRKHTGDATKSWTHFSWFSWFSFDDVARDEHRVTYPVFKPGWAHVRQRHILSSAPMSGIVGELEALLVNLMIDTSLVNIQRPKFSNAAIWTQVTRQNYKSPGICFRVDRTGFTDQRPFG